MSRNDSPAQVSARMRTLASIIDDLASPRTTKAPPTAMEPLALPPAGDEVAPAPDGGDGSPAREGEGPAPEAGPPSEIELKLLIDADDLATFEEAPAIVANARGRGTRRHLRAVYYDTAGRGLRKAGLTLRVRQSGGRFVQTVKAESGNDPLRRGEWEAPVPSLAPDLSLALPLLPDKLRTKLEREPLGPVFSADIHRLSRVVSLPTGVVEVCFDRGALRAGERTLPVAEIELELKDGAAATLYDLALRLLNHGRLRPSATSKASRGYDLADGLAPSAPKPEKLALGPGLPLDEAFAAILRSALRHLLRSLPAAADGRDPEGVHQARVALRRLRAAFGLMRTVADSPAIARFDGEAKWLAGALGHARDADIFQGVTLVTVEAACPALDGFADLHRLAEERRAGAYAEARAALGDPRAARFMLELGAWIERRGWRSEVSPEGLRVLGEPAIAFAGRTLAGLHGKVLKRGRRFKTMTVKERHRLRLAVKKLRYAADFLLPLYGDRKAVKRYAGSLAALQEELGLYNDMATTREIVASFAGEPAGRSQATGAVIGWQAQGLASAEPKLRSAWRDFTGSRPPFAEDTPERG